MHKYTKECGNSFGFFFFFKDSINFGGFATGGLLFLEKFQNLFKGTQWTPGT